MNGASCSNGASHFSCLLPAIFVCALINIIAYDHLAGGHQNISLDSFLATSRQNVLRADTNDARMRVLPTKRKPALHLIFSTDCTSYQQSESYILFHSAFKIKQPGTITRIASGCSSEERKNAQEWHDEHVSRGLDSKFFVHFTPDYSKLKRKGEVENYPYMNKPGGEWDDDV